MSRERMRILCILTNSSNCLRSHNNADTGSQRSQQGEITGVFKQVHTSTILRENRLAELDVGRRESTPFSLMIFIPPEVACRVVEIMMIIVE